MKFVLSLIITLAAASFAQAQNSSLTSTHTQKIEEAILNSCGYMRNLTQVSHSEEVVIVDQGVRDVYATTVFTGERRLDQNIFDAYAVTVESVLAAGYDHEEKTWGLFTVQSVSCVPQ